MTFRFRNPNALMIIGVWFMALANTWHWFASRIAHLSGGITDLAFGLLMGAAFGTLILHLARRRKSACSRTEI